MPVLPSYRNQSIDMQSKSTDWFLYEATLALNGLMKFYYPWNHPFMNIFFTPYPHHPQKWTIDLLLKTIKSGNTWQFSRLPPPFRLDVINVWSQRPIVFRWFQGECRPNSSLKFATYFQKLFHFYTSWYFCFIWQRLGKSNWF